jgi:hypothetical protein
VRCCAPGCVAGQLQKIRQASGIGAHPSQPLPGTSVRPPGMPGHGAQLQCSAYSALLEGVYGSGWDFEVWHLGGDAVGLSRGARMT